MALALMQYLLLRHSTTGDTGKEIPNPLDRAGRLRYGTIAAVAVLVVVILPVTGVITARRLSTIVVGLTVASAVFWSLFQQQFTVVALCADKRLDLSLIG